MKTRLTKKQFIEETKKGPVQVDQWYKYVVVKANSENLDLNKQLRSQLKKEGKYDSTYIGFMTAEPRSPYSMDNLPVYGRSDKYVTKHFLRDFNKVVSSDVREFDLLNRKHEFDSYEGNKH